MIQHIQESCRLSSIKGDPTILFEDNVACIAQIIGGYIKGDRTKHISRSEERRVGKECRSRWSPYH